MTRRTTPIVSSPPRSNQGGRGPTERGWRCWRQTVVDFWLRPDPSGLPNYWCHCDTKLTLHVSSKVNCSSFAVSQDSPDSMSVIALSRLPPPASPRLVLNLSQACPQPLPGLSSTSPKLVLNLSQACPQPLPGLSLTSPRLVVNLSQACPQTHPCSGILSIA